MRRNSRDLRVLAGWTLEGDASTIDTILNKDLGAEKLVKPFQIIDVMAKKTGYVREMIERHSEKVRLSNGIVEIRNVE